MLPSSRALLLLAAGCAGSREPPVGEIGSAAVLEHARVLAVEIGARPYDSEPAGRAADYIERALGDLPVERVPVGRVEVPPVDAGPFRVLEGSTIEVGDPNLLVRVPGVEPGPALLLMAHYDTVAGSPGAADNAASVGILIELARALAARPPQRPVLIAFTAAEESGLAGARALARRLGPGDPPVGLAVSLDLVGPAASVLNGLGPRLGRDWLRWIAARLDESGAAIEAPIPHRVVSRLAPQLERSDHAAFTETGVPAFHLYGRGDDRVYLAYHTAWDLPERLDARAIEDTGRFAMALARRRGDFPASGGDPGLWLPATGLVLPGLLVQGFEAALILIALLLLWRLHRTGGAADERGAGRRIGLPIALLALAGVWLVAFVPTALAGGGHPAPWIHAPLAHLAIALAAAGAAALLAWLSPLGRLALAGHRRFTAAGVAPLLAAGAALLIAGAHELAWAPLFAAALVAAAPLAPGRAAPLVIHTLSLAPLLPLASPAFLREAAFNGFYPIGVPLPLLFGVLLAPHALALLPHAARALPRRSQLPRWSAAVPAALLVGLSLAAWLATREAPCDGESFRRHRGLACEIAGE